MGSKQSTNRPRVIFVNKQNNRFKETSCTVNFVYLIKLPNIGHKAMKNLVNLGINNS